MQLCATPYDTSRPFWYFASEDEYSAKWEAEYRLHGTEEYEIQFIDGDEAECLIAKAVGLNQCNFRLYMELMERGLTDCELAGVYWRLYNQHMTLEDVCALPEADLEDGIMHTCSEGIYSERDAIKDYAEDMLEDSGDLASIPEHLRGYFDFDAYARDLDLNGMSAFEFNDVWYVVE